MSREPRKTKADEELEGNFVAPGEPNEEAETERGRLLREFEASWAADKRKRTAEADRWAGVLAGRDEALASIRRYEELTREADEDRRRRADAEALAEALDERRRRARPGPPTGSGLTASRIVDALVEWQGEWPPTQPALAEGALGGASRTIRDALHKECTSWEAVIAEAKGRRHPSA